MEKHSSTIGIFRALYLGDMLCVIPTIRAIRKSNPESTITLIGLPWQKEFAKRFGTYFNEFIPFPGWPGLPEQKPDSRKTIEFLDAIRQKHFDLLVQMQGNGEITNKMCLLWNARRIVGLRKAHEFAPDSKLFPVSEDDEHEVLRFLKLADALNFPRVGTDLEFPIFGKERETFIQVADRLELETGRYLCVHPGARDAKRRWPIENFAAVANYFSSQGYQIVLTGSLDEKNLLAELQAKILYKCINIVESFGNVPLGELACIIDNSALLISNDTGVSHIAAALKKASVVIFSEHSNIHRWAPLNSELHKSISIEAASTQTVIKKAEEQLKRNTEAIARH